MAKSGTSRHSKSVRQPITIELAPAQIKHIEQPLKTKSDISDIISSDADIGDARTEAPLHCEQASTTGSKKIEKNKNYMRFLGIFSTFFLQKRSEFSHLLAGIIGGLVVFTGAIILQWNHIILSTNSEYLRKLSQARDAVQQALIRVDNVASQTADLKATNSRIVTIEEKLMTTQSQSEQTAAALSASMRSISALQEEVSILQNHIERNATQSSIAAVIAATTLKSAIDRGGPFGSELDAYALTVPQSPNIAVLRAYAQTGVPTIADLDHQFSFVADRIIATERKNDPQTHFFNRLMAKVSTLIKSRPVGNIEGKGIGPITARIESALHGGDLDRAISEWETLPDIAKETSKDFAQQMRTRRDMNVVMASLFVQTLKPSNYSPLSAN